jgi:hypothetical protein
MVHQLSNNDASGSGSVKTPVKTSHRLASFVWVGRTLKLTILPNGSNP